MVIVALKYMRCLLNNLFANIGAPALGTAAGGIITFVLHLLSIIWQLSGGIIRFAVQVGVFSMQLLQGVSTGLFDALGFGNSIISLFNAFVGIFTQPVVLYAGPGKRNVDPITTCIWIQDAYEKAECICEAKNLDNCDSIMKNRVRKHSTRAGYNAAMLNFKQNLESSLKYEDAHECIEQEDPTACICRTIDLDPVCTWDRITRQVKPTNVKFGHVIEAVVSVFQDDTTCQVVWQNILYKLPMPWLDIDYSVRVEATECLTKRSRGESWLKDIEPFPKSYFYDAKGNLRLMDNLLTGALNSVAHVARKHDQRFQDIRDDIDAKFSFQKRFGRTHSQYLRHLNQRARTMKRYLFKHVGMTPNSIMLEPLMWADSFYYRYTSGYWSHLMDRAWYIYESGNTTTMLSGSMTNTASEMMDAYHEVRVGIKMSAHHYEGMQESVKTVYESIRNPLKRVQLREEDLEYPEWPFQYNATRVREMFPTFEWPSVNFGPRITYEIPELLPPIQWSPQIEHNWNAIKRMFYRAVHVVWPEYTTAHHHERFIIAGNCRVMDGFIELGTEVMDYCITQTAANVPSSRGLQNYVSRTASYRPRRVRNTTHTWEESEGGRWKRPRLRVQTETKNRTYVDRRIWRRVLADSNREFSFYTFVIGIVESIFGFDLDQLRNSFTADFMAWINNPSIDPKDWPNVGARYALTFELRCEFPENLNCSIGIGLREALKKVTLWFLIVLAAASFIFPGFLGLFSFVLTIPIYFLVLTAVAWHYSFRCAFMFPSLAIWPFAITPPILPIPIGIMPALPECLWDEIVSILNDLFSSDISFIPDALLTGDGTGFVNCIDVGIYDGIQNILFLGYYYIGNTFVDIVIGLATVGLSRLVPGLDDYILDSFRSFRTASPTQQERQLFCAWFTLPAVVGPALLVWLGATLLLVLVPALLAIFTAVIQFIPALPFYDAVVSPQSPQGWNELDGEDVYPDGEDEEEEDEFAEVAHKVRGRIGWTDWAVRQLQKRVLPHEKTE